MFLTVEQARKLTADENGRCINRKAFRELVNAGVVPSWVNPISGRIRIPQAQFVAWRDSCGTHDAKRRGAG